MSVTFFFGDWDSEFGFTLHELRIIERAIVELISYEEDWMNDDRPTVVKDAEKQIVFCRKLLVKIDHYRKETIKYLERGEDQ